MKPLLTTEIAEAETAIPCPACGCTCPDSKADPHDYIIPLPESTCAWCADTAHQCEGCGSVWFGERDELYDNLCEACVSDLSRHYRIAEARVSTWNAREFGRWK